MQSSPQNGCRNRKRQGGEKGRKEDQLERYKHGHLYVAFSRVTKRDGLRVMVNDQDSNDDDVVKYIVYKEIF